MAKDGTEKFSLKDELFNAKKVEQIAKEIQIVHRSFKANAYCEEVLSQFPKLELKERMYHMRDMFKKYLPSDYVQATNILLDALPKELDASKSDDDFGDFIYAPYSEFVVAYGCCEEHLDFSLQALREITKRFSVEYAIRDFLNQYPKETLVMLEECSLSSNYHERRLASEGLRQKLPWAKKIDIDYHTASRYLDNLFYDKTRYVTRSVANHLNDITKIDAPFVIATLKRWKHTQKQETKEMSYIINHALRNLVKEGNEEALALLGYMKNPPITLGKMTLDSPIVYVGKSLLFEVHIEAKEDVLLMVDYLIYFQTKSGKPSPKVHKLKKFSLKKNEKIVLKKKHPFKANMSTRTLYSGEHKVEIQVNGLIVKSDVFDLKV